MLRAGAVLAALLAAGCVAPPAQEPPPPLPGATLTVSEPVRVDATQPAREPAITVLPDGALVVGGYWGPVRYAEAPPATPGNVLQQPLLWRSDDDGAAWTRLSLGPLPPGALGNSDIALAVDAEGTLYVASLTFNNPANTVAVGASPDGGRAWTWTVLDAGPFVDRPWVRAGPDGVHVVWNDARGIHHARSDDRGRTWARAPTLAVAGGDGGFDVRASDGVLALRVVPVRGNGLLPTGDVDAVAVSTDGEAWELRALPGNRSWASPSSAAPGPDGTPRAWDPIAFDGGGALWAAWGEGDTLWAARSDDLGLTWTTEALAPAEEGVVYFPFLRGGPRAGEVAATWFVQPPGGGGAVARAALREPGGAVLRATLEVDTGSADHGEYYEVELLPAGGLAAAVPVLRDGAQRLDFRTAHPLRVAS